MIVVLDEGVEEIISLFLCCEFVFSSVSACRRSITNGVTDAPVEALDHAICLGMEGLCQAMLDIVLRACPVERMVA